MRDHGGNIDWAKQLHGDGDWIDLSTGINRGPYPVPPIAIAAWADLPTRTRILELEQAAARAYRTSASVLALAGAQTAIQLIPRSIPPGRACVLSPTYNEHAAALKAAGWQVEEVSTLQELAGADLAVIVNPNNPDGTNFVPGALLDLASRVGRLIVDESFVDMTPALSICPYAGRPGVVAVRSFGKFYGLAGLRLGFAVGHETDLAPVRALAGPWPVSGPAIEIGCAALGDNGWHAATCARLKSDAARLDALAKRAGWHIVGGTSLFRLYDVGDSSACRDGLAAAKIWSRIFPYAPSWLRLGLPGSAEEWQRLEVAMSGLAKS